VKTKPGPSERPK